MNKIEELTKRVDEINKKIEELDSERKYLESYKLLEELINTEDEIKRLKIKNMFVIGPNQTDNEIDLYKDLESDVDYYFIYLHNTETKIGSIAYRKGNTRTGEVGYHIDENYQGNNYALKALYLLSNELTNMGISDFTLYVYNDNIASIKTIEKFGGIVTEKNDSYTKYKCNTIKKTR